MYYFRTDGFFFTARMPQYTFMPKRQDTRQEPTLLSPRAASFHVDTSEEPPRRRKSSSGGLLAWLLCLLLIIAAAVFAMEVFWPQRVELMQLRATHANATADLASLQTQLQRHEQARQVLEEARASLERAVAQKDESLEALQHTQDVLAQQFAQQVDTGVVEIRQQHGALVVDVADKVLFDSGEAQLNPSGKALLSKAAASLRQMPEKLIEVRGHTDAVGIAPKLKRVFPTNWELSSERATQVVRYLVDACGMPGERLVAAGLAQFHPAASNATAQGRARNRRIELVLLPAQGSGFDAVGEAPPTH